MNNRPTKPASGDRGSGKAPKTIASNDPKTEGGKAPPPHRKDPEAQAA